MSAFTLSSIVSDLGGSLTGDASFKRVSTDTRQLQSGDLFVALTGEHFDGNAFVAEAAERGAAAAIVDRRPVIDLPHIKVDDTRLALGLVARYNRRQFKGTVMALTGSTGKTSCKEMLSAIISEMGDVLATAGNLNNEIGVPLTLLQLSPQHQFVVIEMGAGKRGDIAYLCRFAEPDIALVTNAMPAHIEGFGDVATVAQTKGEIYQGLSAAGTAVINRDDAFFQQWQQQAAGRNRVTFSVEDNAADVYASDIRSMPGKGVQFTLHCDQGAVQISMSLLGRHNIANALAASAVSLNAGASLQQIQAGLKKVRAVPGRLQLRPAENFTLIDDSYNANPGSVKAAIDVLADFPGHRCLILGHMAELGEQAEALHRQVGQYAKSKGLDQLLAVGTCAESVIEGFGQNGQSFSDHQQLQQYGQQQPLAGTVLVKGSRSAGMEQVVQWLSDSENSGGAH